MGETLARMGLESAKPAGLVLHMAGSQRPPSPPNLVGGGSHFTKAPQGDEHPGDSTSYRIQSLGLGSLLCLGRWPPDPAEKPSQLPDTESLTYCSQGVPTCSGGGWSCKGGQSTGTSATRRPGAGARDESTSPHPHCQQVRSRQLCPCDVCVTLNQDDDPRRKGPLVLTLPLPACVA